jgi:hypothetical protein
MPQEPPKFPDKKPEDAKLANPVPPRINRLVKAFGGRGYPLNVDSLDSGRS